MNFKFDLYTPTELLFGAGQLKELGTRTMPGKKALLLLSSGRSAEVSGALAGTEKQLENAGVEYVCCPVVHENPTVDMVMEAAKCAKENNCDFITAVGGGAVLDAAIAVSAMVTNPGQLWDYVHGGTGRGLPLKEKGLPIVTVALTAGTSSEINMWGVISNPNTHEKIGFGDPSLYPVLAIVDPELMKSVPARYTAYQGFDALFHNTEVMISNGINVLSETIALSAIRNISAYLPKAVADGHDLEARTHVAYGSTIAGIAMQLTSTTAQHSMEHAMSAYHPNLPHGAGLIMISKAFAEFFIRKGACDEQFIKIAKAMGMKNANRPEDFVIALEKLKEECGVSDLKMSDYGIHEDEFMTLARNARETMGGLFEADPAPMSDEECAQIFAASYK